MTSQRATISRIGGEATVPFGQYATPEHGLLALDLPLHPLARFDAAFTSERFGDVTGLASHVTQPGVVVVGHTSFTTPDTVTAWRPDREPVTLTRLPGPAIPATTVEQVAYESTDGTLVPMLLVHAEATSIGPDTPTLLTGYGGFNISRTPEFGAARFCFLERGGVLAIPNLRGGGEYGESWHKAGMLGNKQNTFDDFIAAAEWLVSNKITSPSRLAILGGSNGGLLVGAALTQRPDLFRAVVCQVPLLDMLRYQQFQIAKLWIPEYGTADDPKQFEYLYTYSPDHRVKSGTP